MPLVKRMIRGRETWVFEGPPCPRGHGEMVSAWRTCADCGKACTHWDCKDRCGATVRDEEHQCGPPGGQP